MNYASACLRLKYVRPICPPGIGLFRPVSVLRLAFDLIAAGLSLFFVTLTAFVCLQPLLVPVGRRTACRSSFHLHARRLTIPALMLP